MDEFYNSKRGPKNSPDNVLKENILPDITRNWNIKEDKVWWSPEYSQLLGELPLIPSSENSWFGRIHPGHKDRVIESVNNAIFLQQPQWSGSYKLRMSDNSYLDVQDRAVISYQGDTATQLVGFMKFSNIVGYANEADQISSLALEASGSGSFTLTLENNYLTRWVKLSYLNFDIINRTVEFKFIDVLNNC